MINLLTIIGARPQIIKASAISRAILNYFSKEIMEVIIHTGQHYDNNMSEIFFDELSVPKEKLNLNIGSASHAIQTAQMMIRLEEVFLQEKPDCLLLYGDTNSTLSATLVAAKLFLPIIHIEAGVRAFNKRYPEEVNRFICDHLSTLLFVPTLSGCENLKKEGMNLNNINPPFSMNNPKIYYCGDIMYDNYLYFRKEAYLKSTIINQLGLANKPYLLATLHRPHNTDVYENLWAIFSALDFITQKENMDVVIPLHPRTKRAMSNPEYEALSKLINENSHFRILDAVSYLDIINLENHAALIFTDSGGVQKEAYYNEKTVVILMEETPWIELVVSGCAKIAGSNKQKIIQSFECLYNKENLVFKKLYGDGKAAEFICEKIIEMFNKT